VAAGSIAGCSGVGDVGACGCGKQHRHDQRLVPARSGDGRRLAGLAWPSSPPRAPEWSILPTHTGCARPVPRTQRGLPDPPQGNRPGKRKFAYTLETPTDRGLVGSSVVRKLQQPARPIRRRARLHPGLRAELLVIRSDHAGLTICSSMTGKVVTFPPQAAQVLTGPRPPPVDSQAPRAVGACGSCLWGEGTIGHR